MATKPIPILVTGKTEKVGSHVVEDLKPEVEVIHFTLADNIEEELPSLLAGKVPEKPGSTLGSGNWAEKPRALLLGGAYAEEDIDRLQKLAADVPGTRRIPWLHVDATKAGPTPWLGEYRVYAAAVADRAKKALNELEPAGKLKEDNGEVYLF